jgi:hypothetical protein
LQDENQAPIQSWLDVVTRGSKLAEYVELIEWRSLTDWIFSAPENADSKSVNWLYDVLVLSIAEGAAKTPIIWQSRGYPISNQCYEELERE